MTTEWTIYESRRTAAVCSGATMFRFTPLESSNPARWVSLGATSMRQQKCSAPRGAVLTHMFSGGLDPKWRFKRERPSCSNAAPNGPSSSKRILGARGTSIS